jgi:Malectin domain
MLVPISSFLLFILMLRETLAYQVIFAVNCGGHGQLTENGISYQKDPQALHRSTAVQVDTDKIEVKLPPKVLNIFETARQDRTITYHLPMLDTGHYVSISLEVCEVDFYITVSNTDSTAPIHRDRQAALPPNKRLPQWGKGIGHHRRSQQCWPVHPGRGETKTDR